MSKCLACGKVEMTETFCPECFPVAVPLVQALINGNYEYYHQIIQAVQKDAIWYFNYVEGRSPYAK